ncbi:VIR protein [Plasmodium vivax]|uniref:VIR protein n=1 Tax=Plasmodium vivax TaxID=5855 RepID=A0A1G4EBQ8_PLAVI|nr:VIR protein [Plasmodium vivax]
MGFITVNIINDGNTLTRPKCTDDYGDILDEIQDLKLDDDDDIKKFYTKCKSNAECLSYISPKLEKAAALLKDDTEISCEGDGECVEKAKAAKGEAGEGTSHPNEKDSGIKDLKTHKSRGQRGSHVDGKGPRIQQVIPHDQQNVKSQRISVRPDLEGPEAKVIHRLSPSEPIENGTPSLGVPTIPSNKALGTSPSDTSPQSGSEGESSSIGTSQGKTSETIASQRDAHNNQTLNDSAHGRQGVRSQTDENHTLVDEDASMVPTTENLAERTSVSGKPGDRSFTPIAADRADGGRISPPPVGTTDVGVTTTSCGHTYSSVKSIPGNVPPGEADTTQAADDADLGDVAKQDKVPGSENPCNNDSRQVLAGGTSCNEVSSETPCIQGSTCKTNVEGLRTDGNISSTDQDTKNSSHALNSTSTDRNSLALPNDQEIQGNRDSSASVSNYAELQRGNSPQRESHIEQEATELGSQLQEEKKQIPKESHQKDLSDKEDHSHMQQSHNHRVLQGSTEGLHHGNQETFEGGKHYLKDIHSQLTIYSKLY